MTVRTRFAPSPTGYLHIGGARTALFNWLFTRHHGGEFVLRIEDTDEARSTEESTQAILDGMEWLGLDYDEGPVFQSDHFDTYREFADWLVSKGFAYNCYCTQVELEARRTKAKLEGRPPKYDGTCRERERARPGYEHPAVRFKINPGKTIFKDLIKGVIAIDHDEIEDFVILRSNRTPTYNLTVVVDDAGMQLTHIIRGDDHINNTPKQILIYEALEQPVPEFAHLPMILGADKSRLSKRHGATSVMAYKDMGYLPEALVNYLARLGWSHGDQEIFSTEELIEKFSLDSVGKSSGVFNPEKLLWLNQHYIKEAPSARLGELLGGHLEATGVTCADPSRLPQIVGTLKERAKTLVEMAEGAAFYFKEDITYDEKAAAKFLTADRAEIFTSLISGLEGAGDFTEEAVEWVFTKLLEELDLKLGKLAQPVRVAVTGTTQSPGIFETLAALGKETTLKRLRRALEFINSNASE